MSTLLHSQYEILKQLLKYHHVQSSIQPQETLVIDTNPDLFLLSIFSIDLKEVLPLCHAKRNYNTQLNPSKQDS